MPRDDDKLFDLERRIASIESRLAPENEMLTTHEAARILGLAPATLERRRCVGGGPPFQKVLSAVRYNRQHLLEWLASQ